MILVLLLIGVNISVLGVLIIVAACRMAARADARDRRMVRRERVWVLHRSPLSDRRRRPAISTDYRALGRLRQTTK